MRFSILGISLLLNGFMLVVFRSGFLRAIEHVFVPYGDGSSLSSIKSMCYVFGGVSVIAGVVLIFCHRHYTSIFNGQIGGDVTAESRLIVGCLILADGIWLLLMRKLFIDSALENHDSVFSLVPRRSALSIAHSLLLVGILTTVVLGILDIIPVI